MSTILDIEFHALLMLELKISFDKSLYFLRKQYDVLNTNSFCSVFYIFTKVIDDAIMELRHIYEEKNGHDAKNQ